MVAGVAGASSRSSTVVIEEKVVLRPPPKVLSSGVFRTSQTVGVDGGALGGWGGGWSGEHRLSRRLQVWENLVCNSKFPEI